MALGFLLKKFSLRKILPFMFSFLSSIGWKLIMHFSLIVCGFFGVFFAVALDQWLGKSWETMVFSVCSGSISPRFICFQGTKYFCFLFLSSIRWKLVMHFSLIVCEFLGFFLQWLWISDWENLEKLWCSISPRFICFQETMQVLLSNDYEGFVV